MAVFTKINMIFIKETDNVNEWLWQSLSIRSVEMPLLCYFYSDPNKLNSIKFSIKLSTFRETLHQRF